MPLASPVPGPVGEDRPLRPTPCCTPSAPSAAGWAPAVGLSSAALLDLTSIKFSIFDHLCLIFRAAPEAALAHGHFPGSFPPTLAPRRDVSVGQPPLLTFPPVPQSGPHRGLGVTPSVGAVCVGPLAPHLPSPALYEETPSPGRGTPHTHPDAPWPCSSPHPLETPHLPRPARGGAEPCLGSMTQILPQCCNEDADADGARVRQQRRGGTDARRSPPRHAAGTLAVEELASRAGLQWGKVAELPQDHSHPLPGRPLLILRVFGSNGGMGRHRLHLFPRGSNRPHQPAGGEEVWCLERLDHPGKPVLLALVVSPGASLGSPNLLVCFANSVRFYLEPLRKRLGLLGRHG